MNKKLHLATKIVASIIAVVFCVVDIAHAAPYAAREQAGQTLNVYQEAAQISDTFENRVDDVRVSDDTVRAVLGFEHPVITQPEAKTTAANTVKTNVQSVPQQTGVRRWFRRIKQWFHITAFVFFLFIAVAVKGQVDTAAHYQQSSQYKDLMQKMEQVDELRTATAVSGYVFQENGKQYIAVRQHKKDAEDIVRLLNKGIPEAPARLDSVQMADGSTRYRVAWDYVYDRDDIMRRLDVLGTYGVFSKEQLLNTMYRESGGTFEARSVADAFGFMQIVDGGALDAFNRLRTALQREKTTIPESKEQLAQLRTELKTKTFSPEERVEKERAMKLLEVKIKKYEADAFLTRVVLYCLKKDMGPFDSTAAPDETLLNGAFFTEVNKINAELTQYYRSGKQYETRFVLLTQFLPSINAVIGGAIMNFLEIEFEYAQAVYQIDPSNPHGRNIYAPDMLAVAAYNRGFDRVMEETRPNKNQQAKVFDFPFEQTAETSLLYHLNDETREYVEKYAVEFKLRFSPGYRMHPDERVNEQMATYLLVQRYLDDAWKRLVALNRPMRKNGAYQTVLALNLKLDAEIDTVKQKKIEEEILAYKKKHPVKAPNTLDESRRLWRLLTQVPNAVAGRTPEHIFGKGKGTVYNVGWANVDYSGLQAALQNIPAAQLTIQQQHIEEGLRIIEDAKKHKPEERSAALSRWDSLRSHTGTEGQTKEKHSFWGIVGPWVLGLFAAVGSVGLIFVVGKWLRQKRPNKKRGTITRVAPEHDEYGAPKRQRNFMGIVFSRFASTHAPNYRLEIEAEHSNTIEGVLILIGLITIALGMLGFIAPGVTVYFSFFAATIGTLSVRIIANAIKKYKDQNFDVRSMIYDEIMDTVRGVVITSMFVVGMFLDIFAIKPFAGVANKPFGFGGIALFGKYNFLSFSVRRSGIVTICLSLGALGALWYLLPAGVACALYAGAVMGGYAIQMVMKRTARAQTSAFATIMTLLHYSVGFSNLHAAENSVVPAAMGLVIGGFISWCLQLVLSRSGGLATEKNGYLRPGKRQAIQPVDNSAVMKKETRVDNSAYRVALFEEVPDVIGEYSGIPQPGDLYRDNTMTDMHSVDNEYRLFSAA